MSRCKGAGAERMAKQFLVKHGLQWVCSNYTCKLGEIDLIMRDKQNLVFVEVRARRQINFGRAVETVDRRKQHKIIKAASFYLLQHKAKREHPIRFDIVGLDGEPANLTWLKNAFGLDF